MRARAIALAIAAWIGLFIIVQSSGCSLLKKSGGAGESVNVEDQTPQPATPATIQISYAQSNDTLQSVVVSQFTGANVLRTMNDGDNAASLVRFDGGVPIWKIHANRTVLNPLSEIEKSPYHITSLEYGKVPKGFEQDDPETGPPPPLDPGGYYIFAIERGSGATSYQAVRVKPDLSIQAYDAEPRAGTSYKLCCNVSADFPMPTPSDLDQPANLPATPPPAPDSDENEPSGSGYPAIQTPYYEP